ncbi:MAG: uridine kinase [Candidatus Aminicenantes bacterium]
MNIKPLIIGVAGGSGSGKTTIVNQIIKELGDIRVVVVPHDAYYKDNNHLPVEERAKLNYDHPDSLETDLLVQHLKELVEGREIEMPVYDYTIHARKPSGVMVKPTPVIIVDGILIFVEKALRDMMDVKIFVDTDSDIRFIRRLKRDTLERKRSIESIINQYLETVKPMHIAFVQPSQRYADIIIPRGHHTVSTGVVVQMIRQASAEQNIAEKINENAKKEDQCHE